MPKLLALAAAAALTLGACATTETSRLAAAEDRPPACSSGLVNTCLISPAEGSIAITNGATIIFGDTDAPSPSVRLTEVCWSGEEDVDPNTCAENGQTIPQQISIVESSSPVNGVEWPSFTIKVEAMKDSSGEEYFPLPARITFDVEGVTRSAVTVEVACCDAPITR